MNSNKTKNFLAEKNSNLFAKFLPILVSGFLVSGCSLSSNQEPEIRIVDLDGKPRSVVTKIPELNAEALAKQGQQSQASRVFKSQTPPASYGEVIEQTLKVPQNPNNNYSQKVAAQQIAEKEAQKEINNQSVATSGASNSSEILAENTVEKFETANSKNNTQKDNATKEVIFDLSKPSEDKNDSEKEGNTKKKLLFKGKIVSSGKSSAKKETSSKKSAPNSNADVKGYFVQVGSFSNQDSAENELEKMKKFHSGMVEKAEDKNLYRALLGPFKTRESALKTLDEVTSSGHEAVIKRNK